MNDVTTETHDRRIAKGDSGLDIIRKTMFRLLPIQVLFTAWSPVILPRIS